MSRRVIETAHGRVSWEESGRGPVLVMLHSLLTDRRAFDPVLERLADRNRVVLVDLPGFGESSLAAPNIDAYADAIGAFLSAAEFDPGLTVLLGNGLGAFTALGTAIRHGHLFQRLCLVGCGVVFPPPARDTFGAMAERVRAGGMSAVVDVAVRRIFPDAHLQAHPELFEPRRDVLMRTDPEAFIRACRALQEVDYREEARRVRNPTLIVVGSDDGATPPAMAREVHTLIPTSSLREIEGVGHAPQLQEPTRFLQTVGAFLSDD